MLMLCNSIDDQHQGPRICLLPSPSSGDPDCLPRHTDVSRKRKRSRSVSEPADCEHISSFQGYSGGSAVRAAPGDNTCDDPIQYWTQTGSWPKDFAQMSREQSRSPQKRPRTLSYTSYTQSVQDGTAPRAYTPAYEKLLAEKGIHMDKSKGRALVKQESRDRCEQMLHSTFEELHYTMFPLTSFLDVLERVRNCNEARVFRDITPLLVPSPAMLVVNGQAELEHFAEELNAEWTKCKPMAGPRPKPDFAIGISSSAFTMEEKAKLQNHSSIERPTLFTEDIYFPFLLCEAKSGNEAINRADRQNMHSGSMACKAILELERSAGENRIQQLSGEILAYSISHDNERVKIYGHFPFIQGEQTTYHRFPIESFDLDSEKGQGRKGTYDFVREVYLTVFPQHLKRIQDALKEIDYPQAQMEPNPTMEWNPPSTQDTGTFKIPGTPASQQHQEELRLIREQMEQQVRNQEQHYKELMAQQLAQHEKRMEQREKQMEQLMAQLMAQQEKLMAQQEK